MKKSALFAPALIAVMALSAHAQQGLQTNADRKETLKVTVSGGFDMDWVFRGKEIVEVLTGTAKDEARIESNANVRLDIDLSNKVAVILNMATTRLNGSYDNIGTLGSGGQNVELWDLAVRISEFLDPNITVQVGTNNDFAFDLRGKGSALFYAPGQSGSFASGAAAFPIGDLNYNQVAGVVMWYNREAIHFAVALLPAVLEGGAASNDEASYAVTFMYDLDSVGKGSRVGAILSVNTLADPDLTVGGDSASQIITIGGGAALKGLGGMNGLEVFAEFYVQSGDVGDGDAGGTAFNLGGNYAFDAEGAPWVELSFTMLSGDDDPADADTDAFLSYEAVNDFMIVESNLFGVNLKSNYTAIKIMGGIAFTSGGGEKNNMILQAGLGMFTATEDIGTEDGIGQEFDVKFTIMWTRQVSIDAGMAFLFGSDVLELATAEGEDSTSLFSIGLNGKF